MHLVSTAGRRRAAATLPAALHALAHPATLLGVGLLLLNDHLLKALTPSLLTGKLSDFAGLFVFPFFLIALLALPGDMLGIPSRRVAAFSFGFSALWFAALKTVPAVHALSVAALERLLGYRPMLLLDPTDLAALLSLYPAWKVWQQAERASRPPARETAALGFALLSWALIATSPALPPQSVTRVLARGEILYAVVTDSFYSEDAFLAQSDDFGQHWHFVETASEELGLDAETPVQLPKTVCLEKTCFRIRGETFIERSEDGGQTWKTVWRAPTWREDYYRALRSIPLYSAPPPDFVPSDIALLRAPSGEAVLVAALGNQGVLVYTSGEGWQQYAVDRAEPKPPALTIDEAGEAPFLLNVELMAWVGMFFYLGVRTSLLLAAGRAQPIDLRVVFIFHALLALWHAVFLTAQDGEYTLLPALMILAAYVALNPKFGYLPLALLLLGAGWFLYYRRVYPALEAQGAAPAAARAVFRRGHLIAAGSALGGLLPLYAWVFGWIPLYWPALALGWLLSAGLYAAGIRRAAAGVRRA